MFEGHRDIAEMTLSSGIAFQPSLRQLTSPDDIIAGIERLLLSQLVTFHHDHEVCNLGIIQLEFCLG